MKIALVVPGGVDRSGQQRVIPVLLWLIERLARRHSLHVFALRQYPEPCTYPLLGATVHNLGDPQGRLGDWPGLRSWLRWRALLAGLHDAGPFDVLHGFWGDRPGFLTVAAGRRLRVPVVVSLAGGELVSLPDIGYGAQGNWRSRLAVTFTLRGAARITVASHYMQALAQTHRATTDRVPLGVDGGYFGDRPSPPDGPPWRLLHVASLNRVKDQETLLRALRRVVEAESEIHLDLVGEDTLQGAIQAQSVDLELEDYVTFHNFLPADRVRQLAHCAHLAVLPSRHDAAPVVVLEAAACGLPTVGTAVGYVADWAPERAWAVPIGDDKALAQGMVSLLHDPHRRKEMGRAARDWARAHDADWTAARFEAIYQQVTT